MSRGKSWTEQDMLTLRRLAADRLSAHEIGRQMGRTAESIQRTACRNSISLRGHGQAREYSSDNKDISRSMILPDAAVALLYQAHGDYSEHNIPEDDYHVIRTPRPDHTYSLTGRQM